MLMSTPKDMARPAVLRFSGSRPMPARMPCWGELIGARRPLIAYLPAVGRVCTEDAAKDLGPPGANQSKEPQNLALVEIEVDVSKARLARESPHLQDFLSPLRVMD